MNFWKTTWVIINASEVDSVNFSQVNEDSVNTLTYSLDNSQTFVSFQGSTPSFLSGKKTYTHEELVPIVNGPLWKTLEIIDIDE